jgi:hypothetical protein
VLVLVLKEGAKQPPPRMAAGTEHAAMFETHCFAMLLTMRFGRSKRRAIEITA